MSPARPSQLTTTLTNCPRGGDQTHGPHSSPNSHLYQPSLPPPTSLEGESARMTQGVGAVQLPPKSWAAENPGSGQTLRDLGWSTGDAGSSGLSPLPAGPAGPSGTPRQRPGLPQVGPGQAGLPPLQAGSPHRPGPGAPTTLKEYFVRGANKQKVINAKSFSSKPCAVCGS